MKGYLWSDGFYRTIPEYQGHNHYNIDTCGMSDGKQSTPRTTGTITYISCPFCNYSFFDLIGLKSHLFNGDCKIYNDVENIQRI